MILSIIDFETTSVDPHTCAPVQFGFIRVKLTESGTREVKILEEGSFLIDNEVPIPNHSFHGISEDLVAEHGISLDDARLRISKALIGADFIVGHNILAFDRVILERLIPGVKDRKFFDTLIDWPDVRLDSMKLKYLAFDYGHYLTNAHSALADCHAVLHLIKYLSSRPEFFLYANSVSNAIPARLVAKVGFSDRQTAKDFGFRWDSQSREWFKLNRGDAVVTSTYPFEVEVRPL